MKFSITIEVEAPDGSIVRVNPTNSYDVSNVSAEPVYTPPFEDELIPLPAEVIAIPSDVNVQPGFAEGARIAQPAVFRGAAIVPTGADYCPVHHEPWKTVPAGVSKKDGRPYNAFRACPVRGCSQRPAA